MGTMEGHLQLILRIPELDRILEVVVATQAQVDALVRRVDTAVTNIRADIQAIKDAHPEIDLSRLESSVGGLEGLDAENPAPPAPPAPPSP